MGRVLSGVQPTGNLHLGNYLGAIRNWVDIQSLHEALFCIVDLHAITVPQDPKALRSATLDTAAAYIACGVDVDNSTIFVQSWVPEHSELAWLLSCFTPLGWLNRMTQFKEKAGKHREEAHLALYAYPVLMAADVLLYQATHVPVGDDQKQHLELARDIAGAFNHRYNETFFTLPEPMILGQATRVMSLRDGTKKMSKSDVSEQSRINLTDDADTIRKKIAKAKSDSEIGIAISEDRPEASNLLRIYAAIKGKPCSELEVEFSNTGFSEFKKNLADALIAEIEPISQRMQQLKQDEEYLLSILSKGAEKARSIAQQNIRKVREIIGILNQ
jgi:tryptophanyl-tRNA synthetase